MRAILRFMLGERPTERALRAGIAFVWLATAMSVLHPTYREIGTAYLALGGLPPWLMYASCGAEAVLGLFLLATRPTHLDTIAQTAAIAFFTVFLAVFSPALLTSPFGMLTKNLALVAVIWAGWWWHRPGRRDVAVWVLRVGAAAPWVTEGLIPKILFQQQVELEIVTRSGLVPMSPSLFLYLLGGAQLASGIAALVVRGRLLRWLLIAQATALVALPVLVSVQMPTLWVHPFGPLIKNVPIIIATVVVLRECSSSISKSST